MSEISDLQCLVPAQQDLRVRWRLSAAEFLFTPLLMVLGFVGLAVGAVFADISSSEWSAGVRAVFLRLFPHDNLIKMLSVIATGLVTVTTLTLSALLVAISHTATSVAPVVFDQFLRRRANQAYFGYVAGCATYTYFVMAVSRPEWAGVGALLAVVLAAGALVLLVFMGYLMIDQMRPTSVVRSIQEPAYRARMRQMPLLARSRTRALLDGEPRGARDKDVAVKSLRRALPATLSPVASVEMGRGLAKLRAALDAIGHEDMAGQVRDMGPRLVRESGLGEEDLIDHLDETEITGPRSFRFR